MGLLYRFLGFRANVACGALSPLGHMRHLLRDLDRHIVKGGERLRGRVDGAARAAAHAQDRGKSVDVKPGGAAQHGQAPLRGRRDGADDFLGLEPEPLRNQPGEAPEFVGIGKLGQSIVERHQAFPNALEDRAGALVLSPIRSAGRPISQHKIHPCHPEGSTLLLQLNRLR
jgi:hypothetical protein